MEKLKQLVVGLYKLTFKIMGKILPKNKKLIVFESFLGKQYSDNPRAIYEYMQRHYPEYEIYWSVDNKHRKVFQGRNLLLIKRFSIKWLLIMTRAKFWVSNSRLPLWIPKPKNTIYLQTWHGTPLKKLALDMEEVHMPGTDTENYKENFITEAHKWDYLISPNSYSTKIFNRAFDFNKTIIESGYPRNDALINLNNEVNITTLKNNFGIPLDKKVILYAPTWRDNQFYSIGKYKFDLNFDLNLLKKELGEEYVILLRLHYLVSESLNLSGYEGFIYDCSNYEDISELYIMADLLITDYSSVFFDYGILKRPMLFYVYDIDEYRDKLRGFYFDFEKLAPGPLVKTTDALIGEIKKFTQNKDYFSGRRNEFHEKFCYLEDGQASKRVVEKVFK